MYSLEQDKGTVRLKGVLDFESVAQILNKSPLSLETAELNVDLSEITRFNSASLALLLEWMKIAQQKGLQIKYHNAPEQLLAIARAYGIEHELPLTSA